MRLTRTADRLIDLGMKSEDSSHLKNFILSFLMPTLIGKGFVLYFGLNYTNYPGEGYGYGLIFSIIFTVTMLARFVWRYRHYKEE